MALLPGERTQLYTFHGPGGRTVRLRGPVGASKAQQGQALRAYLAAHPQAAANPLDSMPNVGANPLDSVPNVGNPLDSVPNVRPAPSFAHTFERDAADFGRGLLASGASTLHGAAQLVGVPNRDIPAALKYRAPNDAAGKIGEAAGDLTQMLTPVPGLDEVKGLEVLGRAGPLVADMVRAGGFSALQPAEDEAAHLAHGLEGAALGASGALLGRVLEGVGAGMGTAVKAFTKAGREALGDAKFAKLARQAGGVEALAAKLQDTRSAIAGDTPTFGEAVDTPEAARVEAALRKGNAGAKAFGARTLANNGARVKVLHAMAGTDADLQAAVDKREADFAPMAAKLAQSWIDPKPLVQAAKDMVATKGALPGVGAVGRDVLRNLDDATQASPLPGLLNGEVARTIRSALHQKLADVARLADRKATDEEARAIGGLRDAFTTALDKQVPGFKAAMRAFAADSEPINTMRAARSALADVADRRQVPGGDPLLGVQDVQRALDRDARAEFKLPAAARQRLEAVRDSILRGTRQDFKLGEAQVHGLAAALKRTLSSPWASRFLGEGILGGGLGAFEGERHGHPFIGGALGMGIGLGADAVGGKIAADVADQAARDAADSTEAARALRAMADKLSPMRAQTASGLRQLAGHAVRLAPAAAVDTARAPLVVPIYNGVPVRNYQPQAVPAGG